MFFEFELKGIDGELILFTKFLIVFGVVPALTNEKQRLKLLVVFKTALAALLSLHQIWRFCYYAFGVSGFQAINNNIKL